MMSLCGDRAISAWRLTTEGGKRIDHFGRHKSQPIAAIRAPGNAQGRQEVPRRARTTKREMSVQAAQSHPEAPKEGSRAQKTLCPRPKSCQEHPKRSQEYEKDPVKGWSRDLACACGGCGFSSRGFSSSVKGFSSNGFSSRSPETEALAPGGFSFGGSGFSSGSWGSCSGIHSRSAKWSSKGGLQPLLASSMSTYI